MSTAAETFVQKVLGRRARFQEIAGDASIRRFYRVRAGARRAVLIEHPEALTATSPLYSNERVLAAIGVPVPRIMARDDHRGLVLVDDFGDTTLQRHLAGPGARRSRSHPAARRGPGRGTRDLYAQAIDLIVLMQKEAPAALRPDDFACRNSLDRERFLFELDHFHRHYLRGLRGITPDPGDETVLRAFYADLAEECDRLPRAYCHRDFQSRNLMVVRGRLKVIDFQDARMGPYVYDAASLLRDSSLDLDRDLVQEMIDRFALALGLPPEELRRDFDLMALQRNIKDLGTFGFMATERERREYLDYVPRTIEHIRKALLAEPRFHLVYPVVHRLILA